MEEEATPAKVRPNDGLGVCHPERASACGLTECRDKPMCKRCMQQAGISPIRGCHECAWGKVAGCWRCGSR